jgi:hypothetical protein
MESPMHQSDYKATRASCCALAILAPYSSVIIASYSGAPTQGKAQSPQKISLVGEGWLSLLRWLPPPKLSNVGL